MKRRAAPDAAKAAFATMSAIPLFVTLAGCETPAATRPSVDPVAVSPAKQELRPVIGRLELYENGTLAKESLFKTLPQAGFIATRKGSAKGEFLEVSSDGAINWKLAPGEYELVGFRLGLGKGRIVRAIDGRLSVTDANATTELGVIRADVDSPRIVLVEQPADATVDTSPPNAARTRPLEFRRVSVGSYSRVIDICAQRWSLTCTRNFRGVIPVEPKVDFGLQGAQVTRTDSLQPKFAWQPTAIDGAAYDLIVWKGVGYKPGFGTWTEYVPGPPEFYVEGLDRPEFAALPPLQPGTHYFWSVRIRQGNTVSSWSTTGHFLFLVVAATASRGQLFEFETP